MNKSIKIKATKRTCKGWKEDEYDIELEVPFEEKIIVASLVRYTFHEEDALFVNKVNKEYLRAVKKPYGNNTEIVVTCYIDKKGYFTLSDKEPYSKHELLLNIEKFKRFISVNISFDENAWTSSKAWSIDISKQITVKVLKPSGMQVMGSTIVKGGVFATIPKEYKYIGLWEDQFKKYIWYDGYWYTSVLDLVDKIFYDLDIIGADVKIDGKIISRKEASSTKPQDISLIEIFL